ncbi:uncharacterized protein SPAPADRAFT_57515 [Spathaspora passalidarum NRRL Y-27907]|uniref:LSM complex subunit LSM4 n=1 Tax=Spathaspora passalidarum (strain NRRL Y-27907 / 11-Y1) TaxID=619300 RepID=G3AUV0_SPAPN|nr:uncharacterized protein SPAPADRAFT_57515 [Spathaspora passalidarum NRRL Y-27907]EGW30041.1 hypothetical protein SPAPADRAFT_57515 [Spathaspora passalidarum NRRL Y-27907]
MLPLYLLTAAKNKPVLIELKTGETYQGDLVNLDPWMNLTLSNVIHTNTGADEFSKETEVYIRGMHIKYLRIPDEIMDYAKEQNLLNMEQRNKNVKRRGGDRNQSGGGGRDHRRGGRGGNRRFQGDRHYNNNHHYQQRDNE